MRHKAVCVPVDEITFSCDAYSGQDIVSCAHNLSDPGFGELVKNASCSRLQLIFKYDEANKVESRLCLIALHFLYLYPVQLRNMPGGASNNPKTSVRIVGKKVFIVAWNFGAS